MTLIDRHNYASETHRPHTVWNNFSPLRRFDHTSRVYQDRPSQFQLTFRTTEWHSCVAIIQWVFNTVFSRIHAVCGICVPNWTNCRSQPTKNILLRDSCDGKCLLLTPNRESIFCSVPLRYVTLQIYHPIAIFNIRAPNRIQYSINIAKVWGSNKM